MRRQGYYSESWFEATEKFVKNASKSGKLKWATSTETEFDIPYVSIGNGSNVVVINSGIHGLEGYFGSAAQLMFINEFAPKLSTSVLKKYKIVLIHIINGWGMQNRMREVMVANNGGLVDLNRNFGVDFSNPKSLPKNELYKQAHDILLSKPHIENVGKKNPTKKNKLLKFRRENLANGVWASVARGQYYEPYGLFYGGNTQMTENKMTLHIYDEIMRDVKSLISVGLHTGIGRFYKSRGYTTMNLLVSHPATHEKTKKFREIFEPAMKIVPDEGTENGPTLLGDLVDCLESRYANMNIPIYTADLEVGTGEWPVLSNVLKRMDMGDARYDLVHFGEIEKKTKQNLTESWYPSHPAWRTSAMKNANIFFTQLTKFLENNK